MKIVLYIILLGALTGGIIGYYLYNKPHRNIEKAKTDFKITADELFSAYERDEAASNTKYLDKVIEVSGTIEDITSGEDQKPTLILSAEDALMGGVSATIDAPSPTGLKPGEAVTVKCRCTGKLMDVVLVDCSIMK